MNKIIDIDDLIGVNYVSNGRSLKGLDCYGLAIEVSKRFGHKMPDLIEARNDDRDFEKCLKKGIALANVKEIDYPEEEGDIIFFKNFQGVQDHIGVFLGDGLFIHCNAHGVHVERLENRRKFIGRCYKWL